MIYRSIPALLVAILLVVPASAQVSRDARFEILRTVLADQAASRIGMPFGTGGVELTDTGEINKEKLESDIKKNGQSIEIGKVVTVTQISFDDDKIEVELDGARHNQTRFLGGIHFGAFGCQLRYEDGHYTFIGSIPLDSTEK